MLQEGTPKTETNSSKKTTEKSYRLMKCFSEKPTIEQRWLVSELLSCSFQGDTKV